MGKLSEMDSMMFNEAGMWLVQGDDYATSVSGVVVVEGFSRCTCIKTC